jgi:hypothetical protein
MGKLANKSDIIDEHINLLKVMGITANQAMEQLAGGSKASIFTWQDVHDAIYRWYDAQNYHRDAVKDAEKVSQEGVRKKHIRLRPGEEVPHA